METAYKEPWESIQELVAELFDPYLHIDGTVERKQEMERLRQRIKELHDAEPMSPYFSDAPEVRQILDKMASLSFSQITAIHVTNTN